MSIIKSYYTPDAPAPSGHYSQAVEHNGVIYISGQLAIDNEGKKYNMESVGEQTRIILKNMDAILRSVGSSLKKLLSVTVYISDIKHWSEVNQVYGEVLGDHKPTRAIVPVKELRYDLKIEMQAIAAK